MQPTVDIEMKDLRDLDRALGNMAIIAGRSMDSVLSHGAFLAAQSAAKATPKGKPNRKSSKRKSMFESAAKRRSRGAPWWAIGMVEIWSKGQPRTAFFRKDSTFNRAKKKPRVGLGKNVWRASAGPFIKRMNITKDKATARRYSDTRITKKYGFISEVLMSNQLDYISKIAPNSARIGVHMATKKIEGFMIPQLERNLTRQFARGAASIRGF